MALTEEQKKKKTELTPEEWYKTQQQALDQSVQQQYEEAYVDRELMNKYLKQNLAQQGLDNSGIANLYAQQANTDYMNTRAEIAQDKQQSEMALLDEYYNKQKTEQAAKDAETKSNQQDLYNMYLRKVDNAVGTNGYLTDSTVAELQNYFDTESLGEHYTTLINDYMAGYAPTAEQQVMINQQETANNFDLDAYELMSQNAQKYGYDGLYFDQTMNLMTQYEQAYKEGKITKEQKTQLTENALAVTKWAKENPNNAIDDEKNVKYATTEESIESDKKYLKEHVNSKQLKNLDLDNPINIWSDGLTSSTFGDFARGGKEGTKQSTYVEQIIKLARGELEGKELKDGDTVRFNFGATSLGNDGIYMYYNGKFYKYTNMDGITPTYSYDANYGLKGLFTSNSTTPVKTKGGENLLNK